MSNIMEIFFFFSFEILFFFMICDNINFKMPPTFLIEGIIEKVCAESIDISTRIICNFLFKVRDGKNICRE